MEMAATGTARSDIRARAEPGWDAGHKAFFAMLCVLAALAAVPHICVGIADTDIYFMIATGRKILSDGIMKINPFTLDQGLKITVQQWAYCVLCAWSYDTFGNLGLISLVAVQYAIFVYVLDMCARRYGISAPLRFVCIVLTSMCGSAYGFSVRPELLTLILLFLECHALDRLADGGNGAWIFMLPTGILAEMNFHGSMWPFHFCVLLAYLVPAFYVPGSVNGVSAGLRKRKPLVLAGAAMMVPALFMSPYGKDGVMYVIDSCLAGTFRYVDIVEMRPLFTSMALSWIVLADLLVMAACVIYLWRKRALEGHVLNLALGFGVISAIAVRNHAFLVIPLLYLSAAVCRQMSGSIDGLLRAVRFSKWSFACVGLCCILCARNCFSVSVFVLPGDLDSWTGSDLPAFDSVVSNMINEFDGCADYISRNWDGGDVQPAVFTGFLSGEYMEFRGFDRVYLDGRPEIHTERLNGVRDVIVEHDRYCQDPEGFLDPSAEEWFMSYGWDYVIADYSEEGLGRWLMSDRNTAYRPVSGVGGEYVLLFERK